MTPRVPNVSLFVATAIPTCMLVALWPVSEGTASGGVAVGNPTQGLRLAFDVASDIRRIVGRVETSRILLADCTGQVQHTLRNRSFEIDGSTSVSIPSGQFCGVRLELEEPLRVWGETAAGTTFSMVIATPTVQVWSPTPFDTTDRNLVFLLGPALWLSDADLGLSRQPRVSLVPNTAAHDAVSSWITQSSVLFDDLDDDRHPDNDEDVLAGETEDDTESLVHTGDTGGSDTGTH